MLATDYQGRIEFAKPWGSTAMREPASLLRRLFHDKRGLSAVTVAVSLPVLFGVAGLGIDTGLWYTIKRQNQSAADAAALSAADFNAQANGSETLSGLVYFPQAAVTFQGTPTAAFAIVKAEKAGNHDENHAFWVCDSVTLTPPVTMASL